MDLSALRTLEYAVYRMEEPEATQQGNGASRSRIQPLAPMHLHRRANGLDSAAETGVPAFAPAL